MAEEVEILWISTMSTLPNFAGDHKDFFAMQIWRVHEERGLAPRKGPQRSRGVYSRSELSRVMSGDQMAVKSIYSSFIILLRNFKHHIFILWKLSLSNWPINWPCLWLKPQCYGRRFYQKTNSGCGLLYIYVGHTNFKMWFIACYGTPWQS